MRIKLYSAIVNGKVKLFEYEHRAKEHADQPDNTGRHVIVVYDSEIDTIVKIEQ